MITLGWWLAPLAVTVAAFCYAFGGETLPTEYDASIDNAVLFGLATIVSLASWLIWALAA